VTTALARVPTSADVVLALATLLYKGGMTPKNVTKPEQIAARILAGEEVGLKAVQAVNWIMIVNGKATIWGDGALALVRASGQLDPAHDVKETIEGEGDARVAVCSTQRKGWPAPKETRFSVDDAKKAELWTKDGPWQTYPERMLTMRARAWHLRDNYTDVLCGLGITEEEQDVPAVRQVAAAKALPAGGPDAQPTPCEGQPAVDEATLVKIADKRPAWLRWLGVDPGDEPAVKAAWATKLAHYGVESARQLTPAQAGDLLNELGHLGHQQEIKEVFGEAALAPS
jgi:hypothetical protein